MKTLRTSVGMPPGGVIYDDPRTPAAKWSDDHTWPTERAQQIITFRLANPNIYPEPEWTNTDFVLAQVMEFNCRRLGNDPNWCIETSKPAPAPAAAPLSRLCECGGTLTEKLCATCSGKRVTGYKCAKCGKEYPM